MRTLTIVLSVAIAFTANAQTVHQIPFASTGNTIELAVANTSNTPIANVEVRVVNAPSWIQFANTKQDIMLLKANMESNTLFSFSVDKFAPVKHEQRVSFSITSKTGESWSKEIKISIAPPEHFELLQNYPNPFNPSTTIGYQLASKSRISLKIFNLLGQEVMTLVEGEKLAGYHQETFEARNIASGMYVYQLSLTDENGSRQVARKTMVVLK